MSHYVKSTSTKIVRNCALIIRNTVIDETKQSSKYKSQAPDVINFSHNKNKYTIPNNTLYVL